MRALLVDVDRWDRADDAAQNVAIAEIRVDGFTFVRMERFTGVQHRVDVDTCHACQGMGGRSHQSGNSDFPDCAVCNNNGTIETPRGTASLSHRVAIFRHASGDDFVLVPGRLDVPAALVARKATWGDAPPGLRKLADNAVRHAVSRGGSSDLAFGNYSWSEGHPFGIEGLGYHHAANIPGAERAQTEAFNELCAETGPIERGEVPNALVRLGHGTSDPPGETYTLAFSRDGRWIATGHYHEVRIWDVTTGRHVTCVPIGAPFERVESVSFSPDHHRVVVSTRQRIVIAEIVTGEQMKLVETDLSYPNHKRAAIWLPDGRVLVAESRHEYARLSLVNPETAETVVERSWTPTVRAWLFTTTFDGKHAVFHVSNEPLAIWNTSTLEVERHIPVENVTEIALADDVIYLVANRQLVAHTDARTQVIGGPPDFIACSPDGRRVGMAYGKVGVHFYDRLTEQRTQIANATQPFAFSPDGAHIVSVVDKHSFAAIWPVDPSPSVDKLLLDVDRWDRADDAAQDAAIAKLRVAGFTHVRTERFTGIQERVDTSSCPYCDGAYGPQYGRNCSLCDGNAVLNTKLPSVSFSHRVAIFRHTSGDELVLVPGRLDVAACLVARKLSHGDPPPGLRHLTPEETRHAIYRGGGFDQELDQFADGWTANPFGLERAARIERPGEHWAASIPGAARAQDDAFIELSSELGAIDRAIVSGALVRTGLATSDPLPQRTLAVAFSRDGRWLATGHYGEAFVWDASNGHLVSRIRLISHGAIESIAFSPDDHRLVLANDHEIALCEIATPKLVTIEASGLPRDFTTKRWVAWRPDGRILVAEIQKEEASLSLVDPETTNTLAARRWTGYRYCSAGSFACDDRRAAIGTLHDGALAIWNTDTLEVERHIAVTKLGLIALGGDAVYLIDNGVLVTEDRTQISDMPNITFLACSRDGRRVGWSVESFFSSVRFHDRLTGEHTSIAKTVGPFTFSFDGTRIAATVERSPRFAAIWAVL